MLKRVLRRLEAVARRRAVVVCAVGLEFRDVPWLRARKPTNRALNVYDAAPNL
jgi:hypothetical protein